jgi:hypothetical protein
MLVELIIMLAAVAAVVLLRVQSMVLVVQVAAVQVELLALE